MKSTLTWLLVGAIVVVVVVVVRQNQSKPKAVDQVNSGRASDMQLGDTADNAGFDRMSNGR